jgi:hypothetical protein
VFLCVPFQYRQQACPLLEFACASHGRFLTLAAYPRGILLAMQQQTTSAAPSTASPSFAGLLAALAAKTQESGDGDPSLPQGWNSGEPGGGPMSQGKKSAFDWNDDGLEDDVITLSYERALRANARYHAPSPTDDSLTQAANPGLAHFEETAAAASAATSQPAAHPAANPGREADRRCAAFLERNLKDASITIRMSQAECAQLHRRAAEAGLTVSAYLRSCTFETESLRAMVKDTLAQLRSATAQAKPAAAPRSSRVRRLVRLLISWHGSQRVAQA